MHQLSTHRGARLGVPRVIASPSIELHPQPISPPIMHNGSLHRNLWESMSHQRDSNPRPDDYKSTALPTELWWRYFAFSCSNGRGS